METLATLTMDIDVRSADPAESKLRALTQAAKGAEDQFIRASSAARAQATSHDLSASAASQAAKSLDGLVGGYVQARDALGRFTGADGSFRMSQEATAKVLLQNAKATEAYTRQQEQAAKVTASYATKIDQLRASLDPLEAVQVALAQRTKLLDDALAHGAITADQHAAVLEKVTAAAKAGAANVDKYAGSSKAAAYHVQNLSYQVNDVVTSLASGQKPMQVLAQQGGQIFQIFQQAATEAGSFKAGLSSLWGAVAPFVAAAAPFLVMGGAIAFAGKAAYDYRDSWKSLEQAARGIGATAGQTASQIDAQARAGAAAAEISNSAARKIATSYAETGQIGGKVLGDLIGITKTYGKVVGETTDQASADLAKAFADPEKGVVSLNEKLHFLTAEEERHIELLARSGQQTDAQALLVEKLKASMDAAKDSTSGWAHALDGLKNAAINGYDAVGKFVDRMITGGSETERLTDLRARLAIAKAAPIQNKDNINNLQGQIDTLYKRYVSEVDRLRTASLSQDSTDRQALVDKYNPAAKKLGDLQADRQRLVDLGVNDADSRKALKELDKDITAAKAGFKTAGEYASALSKAAREAQRNLVANDWVKDQTSKVSKDYLAAEMGLTADVVKLADYKKAQIDAEATAYKENLEREAKIKKVDPKLLEGIEATIDRTTALKRQAVNQQLAAQMIDKETQQRSLISGLNDRAMQAQLGMATSLEAQQALEGKMLAAKQAQEWADAKAAERKQQLNGTFDAEAAKAANSARIEAQVSEQAAKAQRDRLAIFQRDLALADARYRNTADLLKSEQALARSSYDAAKIEKQIEQASYDAEKERLTRIAYNSDLTIQERAIALGDLDTLEKIHANHLKQLNLNDNMITALTGAVKAVDGMARAFKSGDIGGGISGLSKSLNEVSGLLGSSSKLGGSLGGIADFLGPIGGLVSGVTSLFGGLFGGSSAKKKAREQAAAQAAAAEAQRQAQVADQTYSINLSLLQAQGKAQEAVAFQRQHELDALAKLDPSLVDLQKNLYAAQDAADAAAKAADLAKQKRSLEIDLMDATGDSAGALAAKRADELAAMDESLRGLQQQIYAAQDLSKAQEAASAKAAQVAEKRTSIQDEIDKLTLSSSELTAKQRETERAAAVALDPSLGALIDKLYGLQDAASAAEAASKAAADAATAAADAEQKRAQALTAVGDSFANAMEAATKLSQSLQALANDLSNSLGQAGQAQSYESARAALMAAAGDKNGFNTNDANLEPLIKTFLDASKANSSTSGAYQADVAWARSLALIGSARQAAIPDAIVRMFRSFQEGATGFATGGSFTVGGAGAPDSQLFNLALSPGEMVNVTRPGTANDNDMSAVVAELKALRQQVADLQASNNRTATAAEKQESTLRNVTNGGSAMMTEAAS